LSDIQNNLIFPPIFDGLPVKAFFTTKAINGELKTISETVDIPIASIYQPIQKHTDRIMLLSSSMNKAVADAVITKRTGILIGIDVADCVPILIYDKRSQAIGAVHAGWRGTSHQILKKTIYKMADNFGSIPSDILIAIGPAIRQCCYEVGTDVFEAIRNSTGEGHYYSKKGKKDFIDLPIANIHQALSLNIPLENIWDIGDCTFCSPDHFFSYRYSKGKTGRQSGYIGIFT